MKIQGITLKGAKIKRIIKVASNIIGKIRTNRIAKTTVSNDKLAKFDTRRSGHGNERKLFRYKLNLF